MGLIGSALVFLIGLTWLLLCRPRPYRSRYGTVRAPTGRAAAGFVAGVAGAVGGIVASLHAGKGGHHVAVTTLVGAGSLSFALGWWLRWIHHRHPDVAQSLYERQVGVLQLPRAARRGFYLAIALGAIPIVPIDTLSRGS